VRGAKVTRATSTLRAVVAAAVTGSLLVSVLVAPTASAGPDCSVVPDEPLAAAELAQDCRRDLELTSARTPWQTITARSDGTVEVTSSASATRTAVHGAWMPVDTRVESVAGADARLDVRAPVWPISFASGPGQPLAVVGREGHELVLDTPLPLTTPVVDGDAVTYAEVLPGVDLIVTVNDDGTGIRQVLRVESPEAAADPRLQRLAYPVTTSDGLDVRASAGGGFVVSDEWGNPVFTSPAVTMWDSRGDDVIERATAPAPSPLLRGGTSGLSADAGSLFVQPSPALAPDDQVVTVLGLDTSAGDPAAALDAAAVARTEVPVPGDAVSVLESVITPAPELPSGSDAAASRDATVSFAPDAELIGAQDTRWPVYIDPQISASPSSWTMVSTGTPNVTSRFMYPDTEGVGVCDNALVAACDASKVVFRLGWQFGGLDAVGDLDEAEVTSATFRVFGSHSWDCNPREVQLWAIDPYGESSQWAGFAQLFRSHLSSQTVAHKPACASHKDRWIDFDATKAAKALANTGGSVMSLGLRAANETDMTQSWKRYRGSDASVTVVYTPKPAPTADDSLASRAEHRDAVADAVEVEAPVGADAELTADLPVPAEMPGVDPRADLPPGGSGTVAVQPPPSAFARGATAQPPVVGGLPLAVTPVDGQEDQAPAEVQVDVASPEAAASSGITGVLLDLAAVSAEPEAGALQSAVATTSALTDEGGAPVHVELSYADFANAAGGDWASRLGLWRLPDCYATTPDLAECRPERVPVENDVQTRTLSADLVLPSTESVEADPSDSGSTMRASTSTAGGGASFALTAGTSGPSGDWAATSLSSSSTWQVSAQSGDFSWSYPMAVPPSPGGLEPALGLAYSSGSVDGRTSGRNNQSSWIGDGWDLRSGYIERSYLGCSEDDAAGANSDDTSRGLCWSGDHLSLSFSGGSGELVKDTAATTSAGHDVWRLEADDGTKVERFTGASNGVRDGEYFVVTTTDGTRYTFGREDAGQQSAWGVPVSGNHVGEPCHQALFKDSVCTKDGKVVNTGWRWNLDRVEDLHANTLTYLYSPETNYYSRLSWNADTAYERGGVLKEILYGTRAGDNPSSAPLKVSFTTAERCLPSGGFACDTSNREPANGSHWPDVPLDLICEKAGCPGIGSPVFFTTKRLVDVQTAVRDSAGAPWRAVDSWALEHTFPNTGDGTDPVLWLSSVTHSGRATAAATTADENKDGVPDNKQLTLEPVRFDGVQLANRWVAAGDRSPVMNRWRIGKVVTESGGVVDVTYSDVDCTAQHPSPADNRTRCFPAFWTPEGGNEPRVEWFNKYVVTTTRADGRTERSAPTTTTYDYDESTAAWAWDDSPLTKDKHRTWGVWRGYGTVDVYTGDVDSSDITAQERLHTRYQYFQGMHDDRSASGGTRGATVDGVKDYEQFAGMIRRQTMFSGGSSDSDRVRWSITTPVRTATVSAGGKTAYRTGVSESTSHVTDTGEDGAGVLVTRERTEFDAHGMPIKLHDDGDISTGVDDRCTTTTYARNLTSNLLGPVAEEVTVAGPCGTAADAAHVIGWSRFAYDGHGYGTTAPTRGLVTGTQQVRGFDAAGAAQFLLTSTSTYDAYGRPHTVKDALGRATTTTYNDRDGDRVLDADEFGVATLVSTIQPDPDGEGGVSLVTTSALDPAWGAPTRVTDPNGRITRSAFDALGRIIAGWGPDRDGKSPSVRYRYLVRSDGPNGAVTSSLGWDGKTYTDTVALFDGLLRERQTLTPSADRTTPGTIVTDRFYDSRGLVYRVNDPWFTPDTIPANASAVKLLLPQGEDDPTDMAVPGRTEMEYDGAGRQTSSTWQWREGAAAPDSPKVEWTTTTIHGGDRVTVIPPHDTNAADGIDLTAGGGTPITTITDPRGRTTELRQHLTANARGEFVSTRYGYDKADNLAWVKDAQGTTWSYRYDVLGRQICSHDPDRGVATSVFDDAGQVVVSTDARGIALWSSFDVLGRRTALHESSGANVLASCDAYQPPASVTRPAGALERASWVYDTLAAGHLTSSTRLVDGDRYTTSVTGYDVNYRLLGSKVTVPASVLGGASGEVSSFTTSYTYTAGGAPETMTLPSAGGLGAEEVTTRYDERGMPEWMGSGFGWGAYVADARYTAFGEKSVLDLGNTFGTVVSYEYEQATHRLKRIALDRERVHGTELDTSYEYDVAGNVLSVKDNPSAAGTVDDNQCFAYDALRRLTSAWTPGTGSCQVEPSTRALGGPAPYWTDYAYDVMGNRTSMTSHAASGNFRTAYNHGPSPADPNVGPHALTSAVTTREEGATVTADYGYDAAGNTVARPFGTGSQELNWDAEGRLTNVAATDGGEEGQYGTGDASFVYTADGSRLVRRDATGTTLYLPGGQEVTHYTAGPRSGETSATRYYAFGGQPVAVRDSPGLGGVSSLVNDVQGTPLAVVHNTKYTLVRKYADPFGGRRGEVLDTPGDRGFLGKVEDATGLISVGARYYDSVLGRFISVDPVMDLTDPQQWQAYAYANNTPITMFDPTGLIGMLIDGKYGTTQAMASGEKQQASLRASQPRGVWTQVPVHQASLFKKPTVSLVKPKPTLAPTVNPLEKEWVLIPDRTRCNAWVSWHDSEPWYVQTMLYATGLDGVMDCDEDPSFGTCAMAAVGLIPGFGKGKWAVKGAIEGVDALADASRLTNAAKAADEVPAIPIYRTPKASNAADELAGGPNPLNHQDGDAAAYFGERSVAGDYIGMPGYADGMVRYDMDPGFLDEFADVAYRYDWQGPGGTARIEWAIPVDRLGRFSELTMNRGWVPAQ
jgi:RHS repeat-associated protein